MSDPVKVKTNFDDEKYEVFGVEFDAKPTWAHHVASLTGKFLAHDSGSRVQVVSTVAGCAFISWAMNKSPWQAVIICFSLIVLSLVGVIFEYRKAEAIGPSPLGPQPEVSRDTGTVERTNGRDALGSPAESTDDLRLVDAGEGGRI